MMTRDTLLNGEYLRAHEALLPTEILWSMADIEESMASTLSRRDESAPVWLFAYGSLMWNPLVEYEEVQPATLEGWQRQFSIRLTSGRASAESPGRMLSLGPGGRTEGIAFRLPEQDLERELKLAWVREMVAGFYRPEWMPIRLQNGRIASALVFAGRADHPMYEVDNSSQTVAQVVINAKGYLGSNAEYVHQLKAVLAEFGISDGYVNEIACALHARRLDSPK
ncbi:gamma-glutamylcyclotransferase [Pseudomonas sp. NPDC089996]|uniref:gamma-glutamylcyclotransferase n=1 Tax=Pseudomonas sp. NPDC089996 TaxID=3364474 RepID=UPI00381C491E